MLLIFNKFSSLQQKSGCYARHIQAVNFYLSTETKVSFMIFSAEQNSYSMNFMYQSLKGKGYGDSKDNLCDSAKYCCIISNGSYDSIIIHTEQANKSININW